jgi:small nuclear ribonucleoprotein (snRNP)-like protein
MAEILGRQVRVVISDGRIIEGELTCMDKDFNLIVAGAIEYHGVDGSLGFVTQLHKDWIFNYCTSSTASSRFDENSLPFSRHIGLAMVPGNHIVKVIAGNS